MLETNDERCRDTSDALELQAPRHWSLTVLGVALLVWGIGAYLASFLYFLARVVSWPLEPIRPVVLLIGVFLVGVFPTTIMRGISKATAWTIVGIGFIGYAAWNWGLVAWTFEIRLLMPINSTLRYKLDDRAAFGLTIAAIGLVLIGSNGWGPRILQKLRKASLVAASWSRAHVKLVLIASLIGLWLVNPQNSHQTCIQASRIAENHSAFRAAIAFTKLARDTFPATTGCGNCYGEIHTLLTERMNYLERKNAGQDIQFNSRSSENHRNAETQQGKAIISRSWRARG
jgi:hypothetical protein